MAITAAPKLETTPTTGHHSKFSKVTAEYRKAHKNYVLVAALLASWELIGIELNTQEKWGIKLLSPRAIPLILFTLLVYSAYKVIIEWNQEDDSRPKSRKARIDFWVAHAIGASAVIIGAVQAILKIRIADVVAFGPKLGCGVMIVSCGSSQLLAGEYKTLSKFERGIFQAMASIVVLAILRWVYKHYGPRTTVIYVSLYVLAGILGWLLVKYDKSPS